jgi:hypothetical protein
VISVDLYESESIEVTAELRDRLAEPFRSMKDDILAVTMAKFVVRRL